MNDNELKHLLASAQNWLDQDVYVSLESAAQEGSTLAKDLQEVRHLDPKAIGPLFGKVKGRVGLLASMEPVPWQPVAGGQLCVGHRPSAKKMEALRLQGATHILTLLTGSEGAMSVQRLTKSEGLSWLWFAMEGGDPLSESRDREARQLFADMQALLMDGKNIYIHCSAGIHRTGMLANGFLRYLGNSQPQADEILAVLRQETSEGVGDHRKAWGDRFG